MISQEKEIWFVHLGFQPPLPLKIERIDRFGANVIGGKTGFHCTGHGETYWSKIVEVIKLGFVPADVAQDIGQLGSDWSPPDSATLAERIKGGFYKLKKY
ncbi:MAG: hypothetical protein R6X19_02205 [Kiritimatiellia bacterium]